MFKRVFLFLVVNLLIIVTLTTLMQIFGVGYYITEQGIDYGQLLAFCAIYGFGASFISLWTSRWIAKMMMGVKVIDPNNPGSGAERQLVQTVYRLANKVGISTMPQVGIYPSQEVNAFATGPTKNKALVAVSYGLLERLDAPSVEGVLGHEVAHIANGDMVTMTLLQGVVNTFVMFFARIAAWLITSAMQNRDRDSGVSPWINYMCVIAFEILFGLLGAIVVAAFSRHREFKADAGGARLAGKGNMISALEALKRTTQLVDVKHQSIASLKISGKSKGVVSLFATHPDLDTRIEALRSLPL